MKDNLLVYLAAGLALLAMLSIAAAKADAQCCPDGVCVLEAKATCAVLPITPARTTVRFFVGRKPLRKGVARVAYFCKTRKPLRRAAVAPIRFCRNRKPLRRAIFRRCRCR